MNFLDELRRRRVFRVAVVYGAVIFAVIQAADIVFPRLQLPEWTVTLVIVLAILGFPVALVLAWALQVTPEGVVRTEEVSEGAEVSVRDIVRAEPWLSLRTLAIAGVAVAVGLGAGWLLRPGSSPSTSAPEAGDAASLAVLPFVNMSPDPEQEYFSDGITEEILNALARLPGLRVPGRTTSFSFKGKKVPISEVARELRVAHVLEGSVRRDGERLRITAQLVDARTDAHLWSETYDRELRDVFAVQEEIARAIVGALELRLTGTARSAIVRRPTEDLEAYSLYLRGRYFWNRRGAGNLATAIDYFTQAAARDPGFARAYAALAETYVLIPVYSDVRPEETLAQAEQAARRALDLDSTVAEAHSSLGVASLATAEWEEAERAFRRALELDPAAAFAHQGSCVHLMLVGRPSDALPECTRSLELDPLPLGANLVRAVALQQLRRYNEAAAQLVRTLELDPAYGSGRAYLAHNHALRGEPERALEEAERLLAQAVRPSASDLSLAGHALAVAGRPERAREVLRELERRDAAGEFVSPVASALIQVGLGNHERALALLDEAVEDGAFYAHWFATLRSPGFDPLHADPRFQALMARLGLQ